MSYAVPDIERLVRDVLEDLMQEAGEDATVAIGVPDNWKTSSPAHLQTVADGITWIAYPVAARGIVRVIVRAASTTEAKRLAALAEALLLAHVGRISFGSIASVLAARDPATHAELASVTVRATVRSTPVTVPVSSQ